MEKLRISRWKFNAILHYYHLKEKGKDVLAGLIRTSDFPEIDLKQLERAAMLGKVEVIG